MSKDQVKKIYVGNGYYTRINRAIKALEDAKNHIMSKDKTMDDWIIDELKERMKSKKP